MKKKYFILAAIFLFNPIISIVDILPDAFGYLFLMIALKEASYLYDNAYDAYIAIKKLFILSCVKLVCVLFLSVTDATMALVFSFSFGIAEIIFAFSAFSNLFASIDYISTRCGICHATKCEKMKNFTIAFTIVKIVFAFLPDLTALSIGTGAVGGLQIVSFRSMFFVISAVFSLIFGIFWLIKYIRFVNNVLNYEMILKISENFKEQIAPRKTIFISRDAMSALVLLFVGSFFLFDINFDGSNILPDCIFSFFVLIAYWYMRKKGHIKYEKAHIIFFGVIAAHAVFSVSEVIFAKKYLNEYDFVNAVKVKEATNMYIPILIFGIIESVLFVFIILMIIKVIKGYSVKTIKENPKFYCEKKIDDFMSEYLSGLKKNNIVLFVFTILLSVAYILITIFRPYNEDLIVVNSLFEIAFIFVFYKNIFYVYDNVYVKMLKYS